MIRCLWEELYEPMASMPILEQIQLLQNIGLLSADQKCSFCAEYMRLRPYPKVSDQHAWECGNGNCEKYRTTVSVRNGSVFSGSRISLFRLFKLLFLWAKEVPIHEAVEFVGIGRKAAGEMYSRLRDTVVLRTSEEPVRLGGYGIICQIDESLFSHKQKNHVGRVPQEPVWVFGIVDTSQRPCTGYMRVVENRSEATLLPIINEVCRPGTVIHSDKWAAYRNITRELGLEHRTVNHSLNFVNPEDGTHTQAIESYWAKQKLRIKSMKGIQREKLPEYLIEFMWRDKVGGNAFDELINILKF